MGSMALSIVFWIIKFIVKQMGFKAELKEEFLKHINAAEKSAADGANMKKQAKENRKKLKERLKAEKKP